MELVMRVMVEVEDEDIVRWAEVEDCDIDQMESWIKESAENAVPCIEKKADANINVSFIEWEAE